MIITFGKYKGQDTNALAKTSNGRNYLSWGVDNLSSPSWKKEFQLALHSNSIDIHLETAQISKEEGLSWEEAYEYVISEIGQIKEDEILQEKYHTARFTLEKNLINCGVNEKTLKQLIYWITMDQFDEVVLNGGVKFSSKQKESCIRSCIAQFEIDIDNI